MINENNKEEGKRTSHNDRIRINLIIWSNDCISNIIHKIIYRLEFTSTYHMQDIGWHSHQPTSKDHQSEFTSTRKRNHSTDYFKRSRVNGWLGNQWGLFRSMITERSECGHTPKQGSWAQVRFDITHRNMRCHTHSHVLSSQHIQEAPSRPLRKTEKLSPLSILFQIE